MRDEITFVGICVDDFIDPNIFWASTEMKWVRWRQRDNREIRQLVSY